MLCRHTDLPSRDRSLSVNAPLPDGQAPVERATGTGGKSEFLLLQVTRVDASGQPVRGPECEIAPASENA